jgi:hypothetical protein
LEEEVEEDEDGLREGEGVVGQKRNLAHMQEVPQGDLHLLLFDRKIE